MKNNKGFSLVELIVSFAILAIAGLAIYGMMSTSTMHFKSTGSDVGLQYEQQVVVNKLRDTLLESSNALSYDDSTKILYVYNQEDMGPTAPGATTHIYKYKVTKIFLSGNELRQVSKIFDDITGTDGVDITALSDSDAKLLGEEVKDITFDLDKIAEGKIGFVITFESEGKELVSEQVVSLRNRVINSDDPSTIYTSTEEFVNSFIQYITIYRNGIALGAGADSEVAKSGATDLSIPFTYEVTANEYSGRTYVATWSLDSNVAGMSVDSATGILSVSHTVPAGTTNILRCTSVDDASKSQTVRLVVTDSGVYPESLVIKNKGYIDYDGYRNYSICPKVTYTDHTSSEEASLCTWVVSPVLPQGCSYDPATGTLTALSSLNGQRVVFKATLKAPKADGTFLTATYALDISDVGEYIPNQQLYLSGVDSKYNSRGQNSVVIASWLNSTSTDFTYYWRVSSYGENWATESSDPDRKRFSKTISISGGKGVTLTEEGDGFYSTPKGYSYLYLGSEPWLDWSKEYQVKVECFAVDSKGKKYGIGHESDIESQNNYSGPVSMLVTYEPVKIILKPVSTFKQNSTQTYKFNTSQDLKRASDGTKDYTGAYNPAYSTYDARTVRTFEIVARGVDFDATNTANVMINNANNSRDPKNCKFMFYNSSREPELLSDATIKNYFKISDYCYTNGYTVSVGALMNDNGFKRYYENIIKQGVISTKRIPAKVAAIFTAWDSHGNQVDTYYLTGSDYYNDNDLTSTKDYMFNIVYDPAQMKNPDYIETYN